MIQKQMKPHRGHILPRYRTLVIEHNKNFLLIIIGPTGSGKSFCALTIATLLDKGFDINNIVFTASEFLDLVNKKLKKGTAIVWDELGAGGMTARNWYTAANKAISHVMQTFRKDNLFVIFTVPSLSFIDVNVRKLIHAIVETQSIDYDKKLATTKFFEVQHNPRVGKTYQKYPRIKVKGIKKTIKRFIVGIPPQSLIDKYEKKKEEFTKMINREALTTVTKIEQKEISKQFNIDYAVEEIIIAFGPASKISAEKIQAYYHNKGIDISAHVSRKVNAIIKMKNKSREEDNKKTDEDSAYVNLLNTPKSAKNHTKALNVDNTDILPNSRESTKESKVPTSKGDIK